MKLSKALGPSGIVVEMIQASDDKGASKICDLAAAINSNGKVLSYWEWIFIVCLHKGKGGAWKRGESHVLKLTKQVMKVLDRIMVRLRHLVSIDYSKFGFVPGRGTTDAIFIEKQLQKKYLDANKRLCMAFVDL